MAFAAMAAPVLVALALLWPAVSGRMLPLNVGSIVLAPPWQDARPAGLEPRLDADSLRTARQHYPDYAYLNAQGRAGAIARWNPLPGCGQPFFATWQSRCLSPFSVPFYLFSLHKAIALSVLLKLLCAAWAAYYAGRRFGFARPLALAAALVFQLSGPLILWPLAPVSDVLPWFPLLIVASERLGTGLSRGWPQMAVVAGVMALGGSPEVLAAALLFSGGYVVVRMLLARMPGHAAAAALALIISAMLGLALAAVQVLPYLEFLTQAAPRAGTPTPVGAADIVSAFWLRFWSLEPQQAALLPHARRLFQVGLLNVWLVTLWLAVRAFSPSAQRRRMDSLLITAVCLTAAAILRPYWAPAAPLLRTLMPEHLLVFNGAVAAFVAAAAASEWLVLNAQECKAALRRLLIYVPLTGLLGLAALFVHRQTVVAHTWAFAGQAGASAAVVLALLALLAVTLLRPSPVLMGYGLSALTLLGFVASDLDLPYTPRGAVFPETDFVKVLKESGQRIGGSGVLATWPVEGNLIPQVYAAGGPPLARQAQFLARCAESPGLLLRTGMGALLLTRNDIRGQFAVIRPLLSIRHVFPTGAILFDHLGAKPRARIAYEIRAVEHFDADTLDAALPPMVEQVTPPESGPEPDARAEIIHDTPNRVEIEAEAARPAILILSDTWYPGWRAIIDGHDAPVLIVDGMFRGVHLTEGSHKVVFSFESWTIRIGAYISLAALCVVIAGFWKTAAGWLRNRQTEA